jgi:hypothetical protein
MSQEARMTAQQKRERPVYDGRSRKDRPEMPGHTPPRPEMTGPDKTGRGKPGTMPENPASIDHVHEPAGIDPGTDRTKEQSEKRGKS